MKFDITHTLSKFEIKDIEADIVYAGIGNKIEIIADFGLDKLAICLVNEPKRVGIGLTCDKRHTAVYIDYADSIAPCCGIRNIYEKGGDVPDDISIGQSAS